MKELWRSKGRRLLAAFTVFSLLSFCSSLNDEGVALLKFKENIEKDPHGALSNWNDEVGVESPCSWSRVECCSEGHVVVLNLKDLCLRGTLAPHIGNLIYMKSLILRNNSFSGIIPEEILNLKELEVLDLGYNNFSGQLPCPLGNNFSMSILLLDNNELLTGTSPEIVGLQKLSEVQSEDILLSPSEQASCDSLFISWNSWETRDVVQRRLLQEAPIRRRTPPFRFIPPPTPPRPPLPPPSTLSPSPAPEPPSTPSPSLAPVSDPLQSPSPAPKPASSSPSNDTTSMPLPIPEDRNLARNNSDGTNHRPVIIAVISVSLLLLLCIAGLFFWRYGKVATVKPWATGLSGQLQRAFITGVPKLKRSELEAACEDFSNVIDSSPLCTFYKGTLSSGVEIAVASFAMASKKDWSSSLESQFRKKIDTLSKVNHKNFVSLLGFCEEEKPFTRMLVFEYAPNGTLFEHLHIKEAEHLDWAARLRIAMGVAYCMDHMHQMTPPLAHKNLTSSCVNLTEDYAGQVSDFVFWDEGGERRSTPESNVYSFGVLLFEMITGKLPYSAGSASPGDWASDYLRGPQPLREMVDPTLTTYHEDQLQAIGDLIKLCGDPDPTKRPSMKQVCGRLREITGIEADGAIPKLSPLWWAELEILSSEAS